MENVQNTPGVVCRHAEDWTQSGCKFRSNSVVNSVMCVCVRSGDAAVHRHGPEPAGGDH